MCEKFTQEISTNSSSDGCTGSVCFLEAPTPFPGIDGTVLVQIAGVNEGLNAALILIMLQVIQLLGSQLTVIVQVQVTKHPLGFTLTRRREMCCSITKSNLVKPTRGA